MKKPTVRAACINNESETREEERTIAVRSWKYIMGKASEKGGSAQNINLAEGKTEGRRSEATCGAAAEHGYHFTAGEFERYHAAQTELDPKEQERVTGGGETDELETLFCRTDYECLIFDKWPWELTEN